MDLCLMIEGQEGVTWPQWQAIARACEEHGVPALFRSDHYMNLTGQNPERGSLDAWATLNALAAITSKLRLGTMVSPATFRHPSELAKVVVTADHVSDGRIELGLGAGWHEGEHAAYGFPFPPTRTRMDMLEEQLQIVLGAWTESSFSFTGQHYRLHELDAQPKPVQHPHPPLIMGGLAGPRSAALAARYADEYNTVFPTLDDVRTRKQAIEEACEKQGRRPIPLSIMTGVVIGRDRFRRVAEWWGLDPDGDPPPGWITGTVEEAAEQLAALKDAGVHRVMCQHLLHEDLEAIAILGRGARPAAPLAGFAPLGPALGSLLLPRAADRVRPPGGRAPQPYRERPGERAQQALGVRGAAGRAWRHGRGRDELLELLTAAAAPEVIQRHRLQQ